MASIEPTKDEIILQKLNKIRCCTGCGNYINYLILQYGLYCSNCLSLVKQVNGDQIINLEVLSKFIMDFASQYYQDNQGITGHLNSMKSEIENHENQIKKLKQSLAYDLHSIKSNLNLNLDKSFILCLNQHRNEPLQAFYQPDLTVTVIINESEIIAKNMQNLQVTIIQSNDNIKRKQFLYQFKEKNKKPQKIKISVLKQYEELKTNLESAHIQIKGILNNFRASIKQ